MEHDRVEQGLLHILLRHGKQFVNVIPNLGDHINRLPEPLKKAVDEYANTDKKYKGVNCTELRRRIKEAGRRKALNDAQNIIKSYLNTMPATVKEASLIASLPARKMRRR
uniref:NOP5NT domain-containing protein n=1 Tax=Panagrellus redivivus TaxID=6233 RepID=A0A7E4V441_PANRE